MTMFGNRVVNREMRRQMKKESARFPQQLQSVPPHEWPTTPQANLVGVWRSRDYLVQLYQERDGIKRLSACRTEVDPAKGRWREDIPWEDLQRLKREAGYGLADAVEVYPSDADIVNVANMRHLWILPGELPFKWRHR